MFIIKNKFITLIATMLVGISCEAASTRPSWFAYVPSCPSSSTFTQKGIECVFKSKTRGAVSGGLFGFGLSRLFGTRVIETAELTGIGALAGAIYASSRQSEYLANKVEDIRQDLGKKIDEKATEMNGNIVKFQSDTFKNFNTTNGLINLAKTELHASVVVFKAETEVNFTQLRNLHEVHNLANQGAFFKAQQERENIITQLDFIKSVQFQQTESLADLSRVVGEVKEELGAFRKEVAENLDQVNVGIGEIKESIAALVAFANQSKRRQ